MSTTLRLSELDSQINTSSEMTANVNSLSYISTYFFLTQQNLTSWNQRIFEINSELSNLNSSIPQQQKLVNQVRENLQLANNIFSENVQNMQITNQTSINGQFENRWSNVSGQIQWVSYNADLLTRWLEQQKNSVNQTSTLLIIALIAMFGAYFFTIYELFFTRTLQSINYLQKRTKKVSQGDLNFPNEKHTNDEIGALSSDFDDMVLNLKKTTASKVELEKEVSEREKAEKALLEAQAKLEAYANNLEETVILRTKKILESEQNYRDLYESFDETFIATDWELKVIHWNKAAERLTKVEAKDALGKKVYDVLPEMASVDVTPFFNKLKDKQPARFMMNTISRETNRPALFEVSTYPSMQGIIIIVEDKTEIEQNKRLSVIGQTAGMVGHDIRNPLQAITSDLYLIKEEIKETPECQKRQGIQESLASIEDNIFYINKIVSDLQDYTRPIAPLLTEVNLAELLKDILAAVNIPKYIEVNQETSNNLTVKTDTAYIKRIVSNLVINAVQAMPEGGKLTLKTQKTDGEIAISVVDTGVGIPEEAKGKIFSPLFTTKSKGQGLGLAVVKHLVTGLKGNVTFESQQGKGTTFTITLPQPK
jgi:PAS domain S-box-containing protein